MASVCLARLARKSHLLANSASRSVAISCLFITPNCSPTSTTSPITSYATAAVGGNSGKHWKYERVVSIALLGLIPTGLIYPNVVVDYGLAVALPLHGHWGFESILEDYTPQSLKKLAYPLLYCISIGTFAGLMYLNYTDVGICKAVQMIWSLK